MRRGIISILLTFLLYKFIRAYRNLVKVRKESLNTGYLLCLVDSPFLGIVPFLSRNLNRVFDARKSLYEELSRRYCSRIDTFCITPPFWLNAPVLATRDPEIVEYILKTNFDNWVKSENLRNNTKDFLGTGIFAINHGSHYPKEHALWTLQRKTACKIFTKNSFTTFMAKQVGVSCDILIREVEQELNNGKCIIHLQANLFNLTMNSIGRIGFGVDLNSFSEESQKFATSFDHFWRLASHRMLSPFWKYLTWIIPSERKIAVHLETMNSFCQQIISFRKSEPDLHLRKDILSLFLLSEEEEVKDPKFLRDIMISFFVAGRDTTAATLSFALFLLSTHKEIQNDLRKEIQSFKQGDEIEKLSFLHAVAMETLRLFPPVAIDSKECVVDDVLPGGHFVPKETSIAFDIYAMGRNEEYFENPDDFIPSRWLGEHAVQYDPFQLPFFQAGPRICLGKNFALLEAKIVLIELIQRYSFEFDGELPTPLYKMGISIKFNGPLNLKVTRIPANYDLQKAAEAVKEVAVIETRRKPVMGSEFFWMIMSTYIIFIALFSGSISMFEPSLKEAMFGHGYKNLRSIARMANSSNILFEEMGVEVRGLIVTMEKVDDLIEKTLIKN